MSHRLAVFCSGNGSNLQAIMDAVRRRKIPAQIAVMVSDNPKAYAIMRAQRHDIPVVVVPAKLFSSREAHEKLLASVLRSEAVSLVVLAGYMRIFSPYFIKAFRGKILNIHPSLLPRFKGAHAIRDAFQAKVRETGVTVHGVTEKVDDGPILAQAKVKLTPRETLASLEKKIHRIEHVLYPNAIAKYLKKSGGK